MEEVATEGRQLIDQHLRPFKLISFPRSCALFYVDSYRRHIFARCLIAINQVLPNYHHLKKPTKKPAVQAASWHQEGVSDRHSSGTDTQQTRMDRQAGGKQPTRQDSRNPDPHSGKYSLYFGWIQSIYIYIEIGISCWKMLLQLHCNCESLFTLFSFIPAFLPLWYIAYISRYSAYVVHPLAFQMSSSNKVGEIFTSAGEAFNR